MYPLKDYKIFVKSMGWKENLKRFLNRLQIMIYMRRGISQPEVSSHKGRLCCVDNGDFQENL